MKNPIYNALHSLLYDRRQFLFAIFRRLSFLIPNDELYLRIYFKLAVNESLDLNNPKTYNQKLQWLKIYNRRPEYTQMVDKIEVKRYVADLIGVEYIIPTIGVWNRAEDIEWEKLPDKYVLKTNHDSGNNGVVVIKNGTELKNDLSRRKKIIRKLKKSLQKDSYIEGREWPYKNVRRKVFAEQYLEDSRGELADYKFYCFDGDVKIMFISHGRASGPVQFNYYDENFNLLDMDQGHPRIDIEIPKPRAFEKMKELAAKLSKGVPQIRVDFYEVEGRVYFGELTFFDSGGIGVFNPKKWDTILGDYIKLPKEKV